MSEKFHVNRKGTAGKCSAQTGSCPFGGESEHYSNPEAAQKAYENLQKTQVATAISKTTVDPNSLAHHSTTKSSTQIAETPGDEMTKEELNLYAYSIVSHNMQPAIGQLRLSATKNDGGVKIAATMKHIREVYIPTAVSDVAEKIGGDSEAVSSFLKDELEKRMNPLFDHYSKDPYAKVDLESVLKSWADTVADYSGKGINTPVAPTSENGYDEKLDDEGNVVARVRLVNRKPADHPSGSAAIIKYTKNCVEETHYKNGKVHDGSGDTPSRVTRFIAGRKKGLILTERGYRSPSGTFRPQDSNDGQPSSVEENSSGVKIITHCTSGIRHDPAPGVPAMVEINPDGSSIERHFIGSHQNDASDGSPAIVYKRADGSIEKTVRAYHSYVWDGPNGEPAIVNYDTEGNVTSVRHGGIFFSESNNRFINEVQDSPLENSIARKTYSWMKPNFPKRYEG